MWRETARLWIAVVAEWLRRLTRNQIPSGSVGSNPTDCGKHFWQPPSPSSFCNRYLVLFYTFPLMRLILSRPFFAVLLITIIYILPCSNLSVSIVGSVVECSPATRAARVRFPDDAHIILWKLYKLSKFELFWIFLTLHCFHIIVLVRHRKWKWTSISRTGTWIRNSYSPAIFIPIPIPRRSGNWWMVVISHYFRFGKCKWTICISRTGTWISP